MQIEDLKVGDELRSGGLRDNTAELEADERLASVHRNLKIALTYMSQGLALYDANGMLILANRRLCEMFGAPCEQVHIGMSIAEAPGKDSRGRAGWADGPDL